MKATVILMFASLCALPAAADDTVSEATSSESAIGPCRDDLEKLCPDIEPGGGRIIACLRKHRDLVSDECKAKLAAMRARRHGSENSGKNRDESKPD